MAPKTKISKQMILDQAIQLIQEEGYEHLTVRNIAKRLQCSTQPIMYNYSTMEEILEEAYKEIDHYHSEYIQPTGRDNPLLEIGLNYIRFAHEEKHFFCFLFQSNQFSGFNLQQLLDDEQLIPIFEIISKQTSFSLNHIKDLFCSLFISAHGCASLIANNSTEYNEEQFKKILLNAFNFAERK